MKPVEEKPAEKKKLALKVENPSTPRNPNILMGCNPSWTDI